MIHVRMTAPPPPNLPDSTSFQLNLASGIKPVYTVDHGGRTDSFDRG